MEVREPVSQLGAIKLDLVLRGGDTWTGWRRRSPCSVCDLAQRGTLIGIHTSRSIAIIEVACRRAVLAARHLNPLSASLTADIKNQYLRHPRLPPAQAAAANSLFLGQDELHLFSTADLGMGIARGTRTRFLVDERRSAFLTNISISNVSRHFSLQSGEPPSRAGSHGQRSPVRGPLPHEEPTVRMALTVATRFITQCGFSPELTFLPPTIQNIHLPGCSRAHFSSRRSHPLPATPP
jgi:hypothetical protein